STSWPSRSSRETPMTPEEMREFVACGQKERCLAALRDASEAERRKLAKGALSLYRELMGEDAGLGDPLHPRFERLGAKWADQRAAASILVFGTATLSEMKTLRYRTQLSYECACEVLSARRPDWVAAWADWTLEQGLRPQWGRSGTNWHAVRRLVLDGLCPAPSTDAYIYGMVAVAGFACDTRP